MDQPREHIRFPVRPEYSKPEIVKQLRKSILKDVKQKKTDSDSIKLSSFHKYTICILNLSHHGPSFAEMYESAIIDHDMKEDLQRSNTINWCRTSRLLYPLKTTGDGNCLLHAVSLYLWGMEDTDQLLRRLLYLNITSDVGGMFKKRWLTHQRQTPSLNGPDVRINTEECGVEWEAMVRATVDLRRAGNQALPYATLESIHLYVLANTLCRPIIVLADPIARNVYGQSLQESGMGGIYLPLESPPAECLKNPIVIGYNMNHFAPLVFEEGDLRRTDTMQVVPIVSRELNSLPVHFLLLDEEARAQQLLLEYMNVKEVIYTGEDGPLAIPSVQIKHEPLPRELNLMETFRIDCERIYKNMTGEDLSGKRQPFQFKQQENGNRILTETIGGDVHVNVLPNNAINIVQGGIVLPGQRQRNSSGSKKKEKKCIAMGCEMFGAPETGGYCSKCFKKGTKQFYQQEEMARQMRNQQAGRRNQEMGRAPASPNDGFQDISIMGEDCAAGCGFKCSTETFPYCHECYPKFQQEPMVVDPGEEVQLSMLPEECVTQGCTYRCSTATKPYCHDCFNQLTASQLNVNPTAPLESLPTYPPDRIASQGKGDIKHVPCPPPGARFLDYGVREPGVPPASEGLLLQPHDKVCKTADCPLKAETGLEYCVKCFLKMGDPSPPHAQPSAEMPLNISEAQKKEKVLNTVPKRGPMEHPTVNTVTEEQTAQGVKQRCVTEGCEGTHRNNEFGLCDSCYNKVCGKSDLELSNTFPSCSPVTLSEEEVRQLNPIIVSSKQKIRCASPFCEEMIYPPKAYCEECLSALQEARAKKALEDNKQSATDQTKLCKSQGCKFFINPDCNGFCTQCARGKSTESFSKSGSTNSSPLPRHLRQIDRLASESKPKTAPLMQRSDMYSDRYCVVPGCQLYGDPSQDNRCSKHFNQLRNPPPVGETYSLREPRPFLQEETPNNPLTESLFRVERNFKAKSLCKNNLSKGCQNFGNTRNKGYCNRCFPEVQQREFNNQLAVAGGNRFG